MRRIVAILGPIAIAGCSLLTSLDGYTGGATPADGGSASDARTDDGPGPTPDGGADGTTPKDFCASLAKPPRFCVDFSDNVLVGADGGRNFDDEVHKAPSPIAVLDSTLFATAAPAARFAITAATRSYLSRTFPNDSPDVMEFGMSMRVDPTSSSADLMEIRVGTATSFTAALFLTREGSGAMHVTEAYDLPDGGSATPSWPLSLMMPAGKWTRFVWTVDANGILVVTVDGAVALQQQVAAPPVPSTGVAFIAGCTDSTKDATLWVDDVYVDF